MAITKLQSGSAGFTLIELLVVIAIIAVVSSVLLYNYSDFTTSIAVRELSEEIGLSIRTAQSYATSVRSIAGTNGLVSDEFPAYGMTFSTATPTGTEQANSPSNTEFILFADVAPNGPRSDNDEYDNDGNCGTPQAGSECVESYSMTGGNRITDIEVYQGNNTTPTSVSGVNIVFRRPNPDAEICVPGNCANQKDSSVSITITSAKNVNRKVLIYDTGQISVQ